MLQRNFRYAGIIHVQCNFWNTTVTVLFIYLLNFMVKNTKDPPVNTPAALKVHYNYSTYLLTYIHTCIQFN